MAAILSLLSGLAGIFNKVLEYFAQKRLIDQGRVQQKAENNALALDDVETANGAANDPYVVECVRQSFKRN